MGLVEKINHLTMKQLILAFAACVFIFSSCQNKEDKAKELVKEDMNKTLHDFSSYEPVEWTELKPTYDASKEPKEREEALIVLSMEVSMLESGLLSELREEKYKGEFDDRYKKSKKSLDSIHALMPISGYVMNHTYRANTLGGNKRINAISYKFDSDLTKILRKEEVEKSK